MFQRARPPADPVTVYLDDAPLVAERGEPLAVSLLAADKTTLARSPKLHRPRSPSCFRGGCDGCLARVDGEPNVMTCQRLVRGGERVESQNVVGSRKADLLRVTDWFFPNGIDHHHLMAGIPGVQDFMVSFARKLAGLGRLPATPTPPAPAQRRRVDCLVIGGGIAGVTAAARIAKGATVLLVDDAQILGGSSRGAPNPPALPDTNAVEVHLGTSAIGVYPIVDEAGAPGMETLLAGDEGGVVVGAKALVFATGAHDGVIAAPNNDLPGVLSARALCLLAARGVRPDGPIAIIGGGFWADAVRRALPGAEIVSATENQVASIRGTGRVRSVELKGREGSRSHKVAVVAVATAPAPAFELCAQAGGGTAHGPNGYAIARDERGRAAEGVWATGECASVPFDFEALASDADRVAADVLTALRS